MMARIVQLQEEEPAHIMEGLGNGYILIHSLLGFQPNLLSVVDYSEIKAMDLDLYRRNTSHMILYKRNKTQNNNPK